MSNAVQTSAMARIESLLDDNSFVEIGALVTRRSTDFNLSQKEAPSDGVVTGYGVINDNPVYVYSQDAQVLGGTIGEMHSKKIVNLYKLAMKTGAPVVGLIDCAGLRLEEASDCLAAFGEIYASQALAPGVIPQITGVFNVCGGGVAISANMADFTFMEEKKASFFVNAPNTLDGNYKEKCDTGSANFQMSCGAVDFAEEGEEAVITMGNDGIITELLREGKAIITVHFAETANYEASEAKVQLEVLKDTLVKDNFEVTKNAEDNYVYEIDEIGRAHV